MFINLISYFSLVLVRTVKGMKRRKGKTENSHYKGEVDKLQTATLYAKYGQNFPTQSKLMEHFSYFQPAGYGMLVAGKQT